MIIWPANTSADITAIAGSFFEVDSSPFFSSFLSFAIDTPTVAVDATYMVAATAGASKASAICIVDAFLSLFFCLALLIIRA